MDPRDALTLAMVALGIALFLNLPLIILVTIGVSVGGARQAGEDAHLPLLIPLALLAVALLAWMARRRA